ncbi:hypothetical protein C8F04DRAFT_1193094 [Mycena alexandri]|uniref:Uncharacterized protein n=1 Tax=Mycena alexandri TaxID=1745969 RepID=A0AAD6WWK6_9AGAR|nr:hypothetical protein C8F04DRAFT_1193094 [Mycena alexandri]
MALRLLEGLLDSVPTAFRALNRFIKRTPPSSPVVASALVSLPPDVLHLVLGMLYDPWVRDEDRSVRRSNTFEREQNSGISGEIIWSCYMSSKWAATTIKNPTLNSAASATLFEPPRGKTHHQVRFRFGPIPEPNLATTNDSWEGRSLLPLSQSCRYLRGQTVPWIFREVYNWARRDGTIWPETLWPFFRTVHLRDHSMRNPGNIPLSSAMSAAVPMMGSLTKVTLRLDIPVPADLLRALSLAPRLTYLEIHQARFDEPADYSSLPFATLEVLSMCIAGFTGVIRSEGIDRAKETSNVLTLLKNLSHSLLVLKISGDLLSPEFPFLRWLKLRKFTITEHTPTPFVSLPDLVSQMLALRELSVLYSADLSRNRDAGENYPPFRLGTAGGKVLTSPLTSVTLSNLEPADPIFAQLPRTLPSLHLWAMVDGYLPVMGAPARLCEAPLTETTAPIALKKISHLEDLTELSLTLNDFATAALIHQVASIFPRLRFLELGNSSYLYGGSWSPDVSDSAVLEALQRFPVLTHLHISLNFGDLRFDPDTPQRRAAHWLLEGLPNLRTVGFSWEQKWWYYGFEMLVWREWDRSVLLRPPSPPSWPPSPAPPIIEGEAIPPWEL